MASVVARKNKAGEITSYQVKWRLGGSASADWQTERFDDEDSATVFKEAVDEAGQLWPPGWVKGKGYIDQAAGDVDELRYRFDNWARECIGNRTGVSEKYREDCIRELETYLFPTFGNCDVRSAEHFSKATVSSWVNAMTKTYVWRGSKRKLMSPKTLKNLHGLLSGILKEAVIHEPPLRDRNPCDLTRLPRTDDDGIEDDEGEDIEFLEPEEVAGIVSCFNRPEDRIFVRMTYGTGMRWGEITALARSHARNPKPGVFELRVARAWKRGKRGTGFYLGAPKSKAGRRTVDITEGLWQELLDLGLAGMQRKALIFHNGQGERIVYSTFYERWMAAVAKAKERGLLPDWKFPTFHDLRHSHAAALISAGHSLTYVQRRLGHESIKTTSDTYGHLLKTAHKAALATIDAVLGIQGGNQEEDIPENIPVKNPGQSLYVAHLGARLLGFWDVEHAETTAERWAAERGGAVRVERMTCEWWIRTVGGEVGSNNGLKGVRSEVPHRAYIWEVGPAVYAADGSEVVADAGAHEPRGRWVWDFEDAYTEEPAHASAQWRPGPATETEARAWGPDPEAVRAAYATARANALRICSLNPAARSVEDGQQTLT
ncbi:site-specific integrase [Streptomyces sp. TRM68367]|uniref:tyrosine-type recombinase/integrase n=1 Tax=Streptomyces sp. TRM68367 TaxID=2758415 RepID=UPI00165B83AC|nr:site-specific integrase [Streptomyces sp. TRM68367]MBC9729886.1 site-specific integrase [Streptomyces sp. TRM68367]